MKLNGKHWCGVWEYFKNISFDLSVFPFTNLFLILECYVSMGFVFAFVFCELLRGLTKMYIQGFFFDDQTSTTSLKIAAASSVS